MSSKERVKDVDNIVDNFIVDKKHIPDIQFCLNKIQEIFGVKVEYDNVVKISGESEKQWLKITGGKWDKQSAKEYIIGLCSPEETLEYNCRRPIQNEEVRDIEKNTNAVIRNLTDKHLIISGTQLAVTLALSAIEELMSNSFESRNESSDTNNHSAVSRDSVASERLACTLQKALSEIGDGNSKSEDYKKVPDSVKRVILDCLSHEDISESDLFASNSKDKSTSATQKHHCSSGDASTTKTAYASSMLGGLDTDGGINFHKADSAVKKQCIDEPMSDFDYFRTFGISVGYSKEEVEEGLQYLNNSVKPTDFLNILKNIKEEKDKTVKCSSAWVVPECSVENTEADAIIIPDTSMMESDDDDVVFLGAKVKTPIRPIKAKNKGGGLSAIEKQEINLQQNEFKELYKKQQASGSRTKGRKDKKMSPDQGGSNSQSERSKSPLGMKRKQADSSDDDQTCVMKVWPAGDSNETTQSCVLLSQDNPIPNLMELSTLSSRETTDNRQPRYIVVDGSNVAMEHGNGKVFSCRGIEICINYFLQRGHKVTAFVPQWRKYKPNYTNPIMDQGVLDILHTNGNLVFTPSRRIQGKTIASYDDRYVLSLAEKEDGIIVSNDQYRDLMLEKQSWCKIIEERLLMFNFVNDHFMPPEDPLGRNGPRLDEFLTKPVAASRLLQTQAGYPTHQTALLPTPNVPRYQQLGAWANQGMQKPWQKDCPKTYHQDKQRRDNLQVVTNGKNVRQRNVPNRNLKVTEQLYEKLKTLFPKKDQEEIIRKVLDNHSNETDLNRLTNYCISALFN